MSLAEQSQQWFPSSVQVTVLQARGLRIKGKNGTNDAYAIMQVAKDKFSTSVAEKSVAPVWKEEAAFDLPLFHLSNAERCTLQVCVMHRALMGPDKMLGQATINLLELQDNKSRNKTEWFKLMGKTGKADKDRGEVLIDIQFMKNNMTASMYDLSGQDKSRSRLGKLKDKLKGKKKDGMSDSASAIVPSVLTDSEGEEEPDSTPGAKKKNKLKSLFKPKPGLHRNISQSMSTLTTLPEKDSAISLSRSSGLNVESPEGKKKFKFLKHKRTESSDNKVSQGTGSLGLGMVQSNVCVNGSHVYTEEPESRGSRAGSTFSLNSSGHGSMEDLRRGHDRKTSSTSMDSLKTTKLINWCKILVKWLEREEEERKRIEREEEREEERKQMEREEEKRKLEKQEEERRRIEVEKRERKRIEQEEMIRLKKEQERRKAEEEKRKRMEEEEKARKEENKWRRMEEEERTRLENEMLRREEETKMERRRAEEEERLQKEKEKVEAEEKRKRIEEEERRLSEQKERKGQERLRLEKETMGLENKKMEERMREEQVREKAEEEEKRKLKEKADQERIRQEKVEMERQKKEEEQRPEVKPRSARLNTSKKGPDEINSDYIPSASPFEDLLSFDESSTNPTVSQPEALSRSTKVSAVKPRSVSSYLKAQKFVFLNYI
uniref:C2 domain-containing protein n=1 Tax=Sinocyclocheilus grahami TaxID=75366 RepID=A0A672KIW7_SINGR